MSGSFAYSSRMSGIWISLLTTLSPCPLAAQVCEVVLHARGIVAVGEWGEIMDGHDAKHSDRGQGVQLGIPQLVGPVAMHIVRAAGSSEDQLDPLLTR